MNARIPQQSTLTELLDRLGATGDRVTHDRKDVGLFGVTFTNAAGKRETRWGTSRTDLESRLATLTRLQRV